MFNFWEMEEEVGQIWDRFLGRVTRNTYPDEVVYLNDIRKSLAIIFRSMGGPVQLNIEASTASRHHARRHWIQSLAGKQDKLEFSYQDSRNVYLPYKLDVFPEKKLNRRLYTWLTAMNAVDDGTPLPWLQQNLRLTRRVLHQYPGLEQDYRELVDAQLTLRPVIQQLPEDEAAQESMIQAALIDPAREARLPVASRPPSPVYLWLHPSPLAEADARTGHSGESQSSSDQRLEDKQKRKRKAQNTEPDSTNNKGLLAIRYENIFSWSEFIKMDRCADEEEDLELAADAANDMETLHMTDDGRTVTGALKFDLDLPSAANDDLPVTTGIQLDEWNYRQKTYRENYCSLQEMISRDAKPAKLPAHLQKTVRRIKSQIESIMPVRCWRKSEPDGSELDLDACMTFIGDRLMGSADMNARLYKNLRQQHRDMSCLLLADLSLSTDTWINNETRVIDIIRDSLHIFSETLSEANDRLAIHGFSSRNRNHIRYHLIKAFDENYTDHVRGRIDAIRPGFYTRMGAAIRHASHKLEKEKSSQRLLMILTDGKPNDLDIYEGRYGIEDTRMAILEARRLGLQVFCVTIDREADEYLPYLFGQSHYTVIHKADELPAKLPLLYTHMTKF